MTPPPKSRRSGKSDPGAHDPGPAERRIRQILRALDGAFGPARTALRYRGSYELLIATILSAQTTDQTVNEVTRALFERWPRPEDLAGADTADVEATIRPTGFFRQKTKSIQATAAALVDRFGGEVPRTMAELQTLRGVARKTANVVLANCWPRPQSDHGIFVDTHVARVSRRLGLSDEKDPNRLEKDLLELVPKSKWADFGHQLIELGRGPCQARRPRHEECPLLRWCPTGLEATATSGGAGRARSASGRGRAGGDAGRPAGSRRRSR
jgi:endonuclease-3